MTHGDANASLSQQKVRHCSSQRKNKLFSIEYPAFTTAVVQQSSSSKTHSRVDSCGDGTGEKEQPKGEFLKFLLSHPSPTTCGNKSSKQILRHISPKKRHSSVASSQNNARPLSVTREISTIPGIIFGKLSYHSKNAYPNSSHRKRHCKKPNWDNTKKKSKSHDKNTNEGFPFKTHQKKLSPKQNKKSIQNSLVDNVLTNLLQVRNGSKHPVKSNDIVATTTILYFQQSKIIDIQHPMTENASLSLQNLNFNDYILNIQVKQLKSLKDSSILMKNVPLESSDNLIKLFKHLPNKLSKFAKKTKNNKSFLKHFGKSLQVSFSVNSEVLNEDGDDMLDHKGSKLSLNPSKSTCSLSDDYTFSSSTCCSRNKSCTFSNEMSQDVTLSDNHQCLSYSTITLDKVVDDELTKSVNNSPRLSLVIDSSSEVFTNETSYSEEIICTFSGHKCSLVNENDISISNQESPSQTTLSASSKSTIISQKPVEKCNLTNQSTRETKSTRTTKSVKQTQLIKTSSSKKQSYKQLPKVQNALQQKRLKQEKKRNLEMEILSENIETLFQNSNETIENLDIIKSDKQCNITDTKSTKEMELETLSACIDQLDLNFGSSDGNEVEKFDFGKVKGKPSSNNLKELCNFLTHLEDLELGQTNSDMETAKVDLKEFDTTVDDFLSDSPNSDNDRCSSSTNTEDSYKDVNDNVIDKTDVSEPLTSIWTSGDCCHQVSKSISYQMSPKTFSEVHTEAELISSNILNDIDQELCSKENTGNNEIPTTPNQTFLLQNSSDQTKIKKNKFQQNLEDKKESQTFLSPEHDINQWKLELSEHSSEVHKDMIDEKHSFQRQIWSYSSLLEPIDEIDEDYRIRDISSSSFCTSNSSKSIDFSYSKTTSNSSSNCALLIQDATLANIEDVADECVSELTSFDFSFDTAKVEKSESTWTNISPLKSCQKTTAPIATDIPTDVNNLNFLQSLMDLSCDDIEEDSADEYEEEIDQLSKVVEELQSQLEYGDDIMIDNSSNDSSYSSFDLHDESDLLILPEQVEILTEGGESCDRHSSYVAVKFQSNSRVR